MKEYPEIDYVGFDVKYEPISTPLKSIIAEIAHNLHFGRNFSYYMGISDGQNYAAELMINLFDSLAKEAGADLDWENLLDGYLKEHDNKILLKAENVK
ncbi:MAG: hypothetical protein M1170_02360 [Patescibacteria group bacterium]|nr:hypothetical protein [Patescibacteria group bacterium]